MTKTTNKQNFFFIHFKGKLKKILSGTQVSFKSSIPTTKFTDIGPAILIVWSAQPVWSGVRTGAAATCWWQCITFAETSICFEGGLCDSTGGVCPSVGRWWFFSTKYSWILCIWSNCWGLQYLNYYSSMLPQPENLAAPLVPKKINLNQLGELEEE